MKILLNLLPLKTGGGVQVALDFLVNIGLFGKHHEWHVICRENMPFIAMCNNNIKLAAAVPDALSERLFFEAITYKNLVKGIQPQVAFTLFGPHLRVSNAVNIGGCAYSNLFYPEIDFWQGLSWPQRILKKAIDSARKSRLKSLDICVFETDDLATRAKSVLNSDQLSICIKPTCSNLVTELSHHEPTRTLCENIPNKFRITLISGYHPNKNIEFLIEVAKRLRELDESQVCFVLTLPSTNQQVIKLLSRINELELETYFHNLGPVPHIGCAEVYRACDAAILPSNLESFSNMIAESWAMKVPLFISDQPWARSICKDAAIYYPHLDATKLAQEICALKSGQIDKQKCITLGTLQLQTHPTSKERFLQYLRIIETQTIDSESLLPERPQQLRKQEYL